MAGVARRYFLNLGDNPFKGIPWIHYPKEPSPTQLEITFPDTLEHHRHINQIYGDFLWRSDDFIQPELKQEVE